ncbi:MAG TPA: acetoacetate decarboxylase family protein [Spirochaetota bacterium]|nr:acetoacetate decarboxylase family protein [Spirochaetota bacterium]HRZ26965.1 acetoacetate decarboxylase family protein [Spirochaetota bacterium]
MKPLMNIPPGMLNNAGDPVFNNDFFSRFRLRHADGPLQLNDKIFKDYLFPTFYGDVTCAIGIFLCSYDRAARLVARQLHEKIKPVKLTRGRSIIAFSCYEYKNVMGVAPYNEIAMAIPVMVNTSFRPPVIPMIVDSFSHFGYYIAGMPVTSYENQIRGNRIWGLPKVTQQVDIRQDGTDCVTVACEEDGAPYLTIRVPMKGSPREFDTTSYLYTRLEGKLLRSETNFRATFNVNKHMGLLFKKNVKAGKRFIEIGNTRSAAFLRELEIEEHPFQTRYAEHMSSCFDLPEKNVPAWLESLNR